jgi:hypothetical protein
MAFGVFGAQPSPRSGNFPVNPNPSLTAKEINITGNIGDWFHGEPDRLADVAGEQPNDVAGQAGLGQVQAQSGGQAQRGAFTRRESLPGT